MKKKMKNELTHLGLNVCYSLEYSNASTPEHNHGIHFNEWFIGCNDINDEINETRSFISFFNLITRSTISTYILSLPTKMHAIHYEYIIIWTLPDILSCSLHRFTDFQPSSFKWLLVMSERRKREQKIKIWNVMFIGRFYSLWSRSPTLSYPLKWWSVRPDSK